MTQPLGREPLTRRLRARLTRRPEFGPLMAAVRESDAQVWVVGGFVRDAALGRPARDLDLIAGRGCARLVPMLAREWGTRGFRFRKRSVTTWRFAVDGQAIDLVDASRRGLEADLARRDLTINAIAFDPRTERLRDPLRGRSDLSRRRLRPPVAGAFDEDPLRALRLARFLAELPTFQATGPTLRLASRAAPRTGRAAPERLLAELDRLLSASAPHRGLEAMRRTGLIDSVLPELVPLWNCLAGQDRPDVWTHTVAAIQRSSGPRRLPGALACDTPEVWRVLRWSLLLHDISKPQTLGRAADGRPTFHGHESLGADRADAVLRRLRAPRERRKRVGRLIRAHLRPGHLADAGATARGLGRLARELGADLPLLTFHAACDALASGSPNPRARWLRLRQVLLALLARSVADDRGRRPALLDGRTVMRVTGLPAGPAIGRWLERLAEARDAGEVTTPEAARAWLRRQVATRSA